MKQCDNRSLDAKFLSPRTLGTGANPTRRSFLAGSAAAGALGLLRPGSPSSAEASSASESAHAPAAAGSDAIRPFRVSFPEAWTWWICAGALSRHDGPGEELVSDVTQGVQLATMQKLANYWATDYNWRKVESRLNALPQFITTVDGLDIHFIHVTRRKANALPVIITHGWPGSIIEQMKVYRPAHRSRCPWWKRQRMLLTSSFLRCRATAPEQAGGDRMGSPSASRARGLC